MRKEIRFVGVALAVLLLEMAPASAQSITLGGSGGLLGGGLSSGSTDSSVDVNLGGSGNDLEVHLLGSSNTDGEVSVDLFDDNVLGSGTGNSNASVRLFGAPGGTASNNSVDVNLGGDAQDDAVFSLFGAPGGGSQTANLDIFGGGAGGVGTGVPGGDADATLSLFGSGNGEGVDPTQTGSTGGPGSGGNDGTEIFTPGGSGTQPMPRPGTIRPNASSTVRVAAAGSAACFAPDPTQINNLLGRSSYSVAVTTSWKSADNINLVPINLCPNSRADLEAALAADPNIGFLHSAVAADAEITAALDPGYDPEDVLAVDKSGEDLTVYVY